MRPGITLCQTKTGAAGFTKFFHVKKAALHTAIMERLRQDLALQASAAAMARDEAISEESQPENKWDTHSQEAAYLAEGQAKLAAEIRANLEVYATLPVVEFAPTDAIALGALVALETTSGGRKRSWFFVGPRAGGLEVSVEAHDVLVLTPVSPLGRQLIGKRVGDRVQTTGRGAPVEQTIVHIA